MYAGQEINVWVYKLRCNWVVHLILNRGEIQVDNEIKVSDVVTVLLHFAPCLPQPFNMLCRSEFWIQGVAVLSSRALCSSLNSITFDLKSGPTYLYTITAIFLQSATRCSVESLPHYFLCRSYAQFSFVVIGGEEMQLLMVPCAHRVRHRFQFLQQIIANMEYFYQSLPTRKDKHT